MNPDIVILIAFCLFLAFVLLEVPIGVSLVIGGAVGIVLLEGAGVAEAVLGGVPYSATSSYAMFAIPGFVLMGAVISNAGLSRHIFSSVGRLLHWLPNGIAVTAVMATTIMSGISGSSAANVATMGRISITEMQKEGYEPSQAAAIVSAAGAFGALMPPAIGLVIYGIVAGESVGALLIAGVIPALMSALALMIYLVVLGRNKRLPEIDAVALGSRIREAASKAEGGPSSKLSVQTLERSSNDSGTLIGTKGAGVAASDLTNRIVSLSIVGALFVLVMGGIYAGYMTATEAAAVGGVGALILVLIFARRAGAPNRWLVLKESLGETTRTSAMIFLLLIGGAMVTYLVVASNIPSRLTDAVLALPIPPIFVIAVFLLILIPLGMFLDGMSIILLTVPIVAPVVTSLGFDGIWFGILFMKMMEIGLITPPVGMNCFIAAGVVPNIRVEDVFRHVLPFVLLDLGLTAILFLVPGLVTWLPNLMV